MNRKKDEQQTAFAVRQMGFEIVIPAGEHLGATAVYKFRLGTQRYFIWKGKSLLQSCELLCKSISAGISKMNRGFKIEEEDYLYHVLKYIKSSRCKVGTVEIIADDFLDDEGKIDGLAVLKEEQRLLDEADGDIYCLNNNEQSYVPVNNLWITEPMKNKFFKWYKTRRK